MKHKNQVRSKEDGVVSNNNNNIRTRHAGVLGLCAFINSHPYDVPDFLPDVFEQLRPHLSDPQPIPVSIFYFSEWGFSYFPKFSIISIAFVRFS